MCRIEYIEIEMHREMREPLGRDPVEDRPAAVSNGGGRDMPDAQILQDRVFIRAPPLHAGDHHLPGVQLAGHFGRESLVAPAKQKPSTWAWACENSAALITSGWASSQSTPSFSP